MLALAEEEREDVLLFYSSFSSSFIPLSLIFFVACVHWYERIAFSVVVGEKEHRLADPIAMVFARREGCG